MAKYRITPSSRAIVQSPVSIGHKAEKGVEAIEFDVAAWVETYGSGTLTVIMRRWGDAIPYPIALEIDENNKATWTLSDTDTAKAGMAYAQLSYIVGETVVKKSDIYTFRVMDSLTGEGDPPEAYESWLEHLTHLAAEAMAEVLDIESIVTDKTLTVDGGIADAKATGDALALKADRSTTYTKAQVNQMISDVEVETDTTLAISGAPADSKKVGDELTAIKADLGAQTELINGIPAVTDFIANKSITAMTGVMGDASANFVATDYVEIPEGVTAIWITARIAASYSNLGLSFYDANKEYVFGVREKNASAKSWEVKKVDVPEGAVYFRSTYYSDADTTPHPKFSVYTDKQFAQRLNEMQAQIDDAIIPTEDLEYVNVFDPNDEGIEEGYELAPNGNKTANSVMMISGYIPCVELQKYTLPVYTSHFGTSNSSYVACFNASKEWVRSVQGTRTGAVLAFGVPSGYGIKYFRVNVAMLDANSNYIQSPYHSRSNFMVVKGQTLPDRFIPYTEQKLMDGNVYSANEDLRNPLYGKKVVFMGDSICEASTDDNGGFSQRIGMKNTMLWENAGIGGSTIAITGANKTICTRQFKMTDPDYIILEGGTNDADRIGTATGETKPANFGTYDPDDYGTDDASTYYGFDINTFCGACDYMCKRMLTDYAGAKIGFIGAHKMGQVLATRKNRGYYIQTAMDICKKWGIPVLDLWNGSYLNPMLPAHYTSGENYLYADGQHLYSKGYAYITPMIEAFMKSL